MSGLTTNELQEIDITYYLQLMSFTILIYEYCLTFPLEVQRFWSAKKITFTVLFFFLHRYFVLLGSVPVMVQKFWYASGHAKQLSCRSLRVYSITVAVVIQVLISVILIVRTYALYDRSRRVLALIIGALLATISVGCWSIVSRRGPERDHRHLENYLVIGCPSPLSRAAALMFAKAWGGLLVFETLIFALTVYKSLALRARSGSGIFALMLRDGSMYFGLIVAATVANILTYVYGGTFTRGAATVFVNCISSVMVTRLMLNLRDPSLLAISRPPTTTVDYYSSAIFSTVHFETENGGSTHCHDHLEYLAQLPPHLASSVCRQTS